MNSEERTDSPDIRDALGSIGLSALVVIGGAILSQGLGFGTRVVMTRYLPVSGYGNVTLGVTVLNIFGIVSILGLGPALTRYLPRTDNDSERKQIVTSASQIGLILSIVWGAVMILTADSIGVVVFNSPNLAKIIRIFALALPFYVLYQLSVKAIRGLGMTAPNVLIDKIVLPSSRLVCIILFTLSGFGTLGIALGYNIAFIVAGLVGTYFLSRFNLLTIGSITRSIDIPQSRELLAFSLPLAVTASINLITKQTDIFVLGIFRPSSAVAIYDIAFLLSQFMLFFSPPLDYLFQPLISKYESEGEKRKMERMYTVITRWVVALSFPAAALFVLFPETILGMFFGNEYRAGGTALAILAVGFFLTRLVGFTGSFLTATGDTKTLMYISFGTAAANLVLNVIFVSIYGIIGAALATAAARILNNLFQSAYIYFNYGLHPFKPAFVYPTTLTAACFLGVYYTMAGSIGGSIYLAFAFAACFGILYLFFTAVTRSVYAVELHLVDSLLAKVGIHLSLSERLRSITIDRN